MRCCSDPTVEREGRVLVDSEGECGARGFDAILDDDNFADTTCGTGYGCEDSTF